MKTFIQQTILSLFAIMLFALTAKASDCLPEKMTINDSQTIDESVDMNMTYYFVETQLSDNCDKPYDSRRLIIMVATLEAGDIETSIEEEKYGNLVEEKAWNIRINTSYFDTDAEPTMLLMDRGEDLGAGKSNRGGVFYCQQGRCHLKKSTQYNVSSNHDIVVQSVPRLINGDGYTTGLHSPDEVDERIGLAINRDGQTLIFYSRRASFNELRYFLKTELDVNEALALDGGNSSSFHALVRAEDSEVNEINLAHGWLWTPVPYFINFSHK